MQSIWLVMPELFHLKISQGQSSKGKGVKNGQSDAKKAIAFMCNGKCKIGAELKNYLEEGKNKISVLNAVRTKLVHRIMAVIRRKQPFLPREEFLSLKNSNLFAY